MSDSTHMGSWNNSSKSDNCHRYGFDIDRSLRSAINDYIQFYKYLHSVLVYRSPMDLERCCIKNWVPTLRGKFHLLRGSAKSRC